MKLPDELRRTERTADERRNARRWLLAASVVVAAVLALGLRGRLTAPPTPPPAQTDPCPRSMPAGDWAECVAEQARRRTSARCDRLRSTRADQLEPHEWAQLARC